MRKILTGVLGVAGLLAVVLALAASPASAAKQVVTITTAADPQAGDYVASWETLGGCDPGAGTSGASGSITLTVAPSAPGAATGAAEESGVVTDTECNYEWEFTFTNAAGANCGITSAPAAPVSTTETITLTGSEADACDRVVDVVVTIVATAPVICTAADVAAAIGSCDGGTAGETVKIPATVSDLNVGAVAGTTFTVTATPVGATQGDDPDEDCLGDSGDTEVAEEGGPNEVTLRLVEATAGDVSDDGNCQYDISVALPDGFVTSVGNKNSNVKKGISPTANDPATDDDGDGTTPAATDDNPGDDQQLSVAVAMRQVYLVQRVHGDAGGASASYDMADTDSCSAPGIPDTLDQTERSGGISSVGGETVVELRTGSFNISGALTENFTSGDPKHVAALDKNGDACEASVSIKGVPAHCTVQSNSPVDLSASGEEVIIEFDIDCRPPAASEPMPEQPAEGDTGAMTDADDMTGADDGGGEDMTGGDGHMDDDGMGDMGPPADVPTG